MQNLLSSLPFLACPLGMGVMMWLMMRGKRQKPDVTPVHSDNRLQALHTEMDQVHAQMNQLMQGDRGLSSTTSPPSAASGIRRR